MAPWVNLIIFTSAQKEISDNHRLYLTAEVEASNMTLSAIQIRGFSIRFAYDPAVK